MMRSRAAVVAIVLALVASGWAGCGTRDQPQSAATRAYHPFYPLTDAASDARGTIKGDYRWAADSPTMAEAAERWRAFLKSHQPPDGEYQDGFQRNFVRAAQFESMRVEYLLGRVAEGDSVLRNLEDVGGR